MKTRNKIEKSYKTMTIILVLALLVSPSLFAQPQISLSPNTADYVFTLGSGSAPANQIIQISNPGDAELDWRHTDTVSWLNLSYTGNQKVPSGGGTQNVTLSTITAGSLNGYSSGTYNGTIEIYDFNDNNIKQTITVSLVINTKPSLSGVINDSTVTVGQTIQFTVTASEPDANGAPDLSFVDPTPSGAFWDNTNTSIPNTVSKRFNWSPTVSHLGSNTFTIKASDGIADSIDVLNLTVIQNGPPVINNTAPITKTIWSGKSFSNINFSGRATDPNGDNFSWEVVGTPTNITAVLQGGSTDIFQITNNNPSQSFGEQVEFKCRDDKGNLSTGSVMVTFNHVLLTFTQTNFGNNLVGYTDTLNFSIENQTGGTISLTSITENSSELTLERTDGASNLVADLTDGITRNYRAIWAPGLPTTNLNQSIVFTGTGFEATQQYTVTGVSKSVIFTSPNSNTHDFGYVNAVDIRASDTTAISMTNTGNINAEVTSISLKTNNISDFHIMSPSTPHTYQAGISDNVTISCIPTGTGPKNTDLWFKYTVDLGDKTIIDSLKVLDLSATGQNPICNLSATSINFGAVDTSNCRNIIFSINNTSNVPNVYDDISLDAVSSVYQLEPLSFPLFVQPGSFDITLTYCPSSIGINNINVQFSDSSGSTVGPISVTGRGIEAIWGCGNPDNISWVNLCGPDENQNHSISNAIDSTIDINNIRVLPTGYDNWFTFTQPLSSYKSINGLGNLTFQYTFKPLDTTASVITFSFEIAYNDPYQNGKKDTVFCDFLSAGVRAGKLRNITNKTFPNTELGEADTLDIVLNNDGNYTLTIDSVKVAAPYTVINPSFNIAANSSSTLRIIFTPSTLGVSNKVVSVYHNGHLGGDIDPATDCPLENTNTFQVIAAAVDTKAPEITTEPSFNPNTGIISLDASDQGGTGIDSVIVIWRYGNADTNDTLFQVLTSSPYSVDVASNRADTTGLEMSFRLVDNAIPPNDTTLEWSNVSSPFASGDFEYTVNEWLNQVDSNWHLVTIPANLDNATISNIFMTNSGLGTSTGDAQNDRWRIYRYTGNNNYTQLQTGIINSVIPGEGYWFRHHYSDITLTLPSGSTVQTLTPFNIQLDNGWNLIGNPYLFDIWINSADLNSVIVQTVKDRNTGASDNAAFADWQQPLFTTSNTVKLEVGRGYAFECNCPGGATLALNPHTPSSAIAQPIEGVWHLPITLISAGSVKGKVTIGYNPLSDDVLDIYDMKPINWFNAKNNFIIKNDFDTDLLTDIRYSDNLQKWKLDILSSNDAAMKLNWDIETAKQKGKTIVLRDVLTEQIIDMTENSSYDIPIPFRIPSGRFIVYMGNRSEVEQAISKPEEMVPYRFSLYQNYPNPFNPATTVAFDLPQATDVQLVIYNILGQKVTTLVDNYLSAGSYNYNWDATDDKGQKVASGLYFAKLITDENAETIKMALIK